MIAKRKNLILVLTISFLVSVFSGFHFKQANKDKIFNFVDSFNKISEYNNNGRFTYGPKDIPPLKNVTQDSINDNTVEVSQNNIKSEADNTTNQKVKSKRSEGIEFFAKLINEEAARRKKDVSKEDSYLAIERLNRKFGGDDERIGGIRLDDGTRVTPTEFFNLGNVWEEADKVVRNSMMGAEKDPYDFTVVLSEKPPIPVSDIEVKQYEVIHNLPIQKYVSLGKNLDLTNSALKECVNFFSLKFFDFNYIAFIITFVLIFILLVSFFHTIQNFLKRVDKIN